MKAILPLLCLLLLIAAGCATVGTPVAQDPLPPGAPDVAEILAGLRANDAAVASLSATGKFILKTPELDTVYVLPQSSIHYARPDRIAIVGRKYLGYNVVNIIGQGNAFLLELPTENQYAWRPEGERFQGVSFAISPADVAFEALLTGGWATQSDSSTRLVAWDEATGSASLEIADPERPRRLIRTATAQAIGGIWTITQSNRYDDNGTLIATTQRSDFHALDGAVFPRQIVSAFPSASARMEFTLRKITINPELDSALFDVDANRQRMIGAGYTEIETQNAPRKNFR